MLYMHWSPVHNNAESELLFLYLLSGKGLQSGESTLIAQQPSLCLFPDPSSLITPSAGFIRYSQWYPSSIWTEPPQCAVPMTPSFIWTEPPQCAVRCCKALHMSHPHDRSLIWWWALFIHSKWNNGTGRENPCSQTTETEKGRAGLEFVRHRSAHWQGFLAHLVVWEFILQTYLKMCLTDRLNFIFSYCCDPSMRTWCLCIFCQCS